MKTAYSDTIRMAKIISLPIIGATLNVTQAKTCRRKLSAETDAVITWLTINP